MQFLVQYLVLFLVLFLVQFLVQFLVLYFRFSRAISGALSRALSRAISRATSRALSRALSRATVTEFFFFLKKGKKHLCQSVPFVLIAKAELAFGLQPLAQIGHQLEKCSQQQFQGPRFWNFEQGVSMMFPDSQPPAEDPFWQVSASLGRARILTQRKFRGA